MHNVIDIIDVTQDKDEETVNGKDEDNAAKDEDGKLTGGEAVEEGTAENQPKKKKKEVVIFVEISALGYFPLLVTGC